MKKIAVAMIAAGLSLFAVAPSIAGATQDPDLHCPDGGTKVEANGENQAEINALILPAGTLVCVKAGPGNTDIVTADGEKDLQDILFDAGIKNGSGTDGKDVSYYVIYESETTTTTTTEPPVVTTTTQPPVTTTTQPPVTTTTEPPAVTTTTQPPVVTGTQCVTPDGFAYTTNLSECPPAAETPVVTQTPITALPRTGSWSLFLALLGTAAGLTGLGLMLFSRSLRRSEES